MLVTWELSEVKFLLPFFLSTLSSALLRGYRFTFCGLRMQQNVNSLFTFNTVLQIMTYLRTSASFKAKNVRLLLTWFSDKSCGKTNRERELNNRIKLDKNCANVKFTFSWPACLISPMEKKTKRAFDEKIKLHWITIENGKISFCTKMNQEIKQDKIELNHIYPLGLKPFLMNTLCYFE